MMRLTLGIVAETLFGAAVGPEVDAVSSAMDRNVLMFRWLVSPWGLLKAALLGIALGNLLPIIAR